MKNNSAIVEMNLQDLQEVNGGVIPVVVWIVTAVIVGVGVNHVVNDR